MGKEILLAMFFLFLFFYSETHRGSLWVAEAHGPCAYLWISLASWCYTYSRNVNRILKYWPACVSFALQLGVTFQQSLVLGNTSHYPVNPSLMIGDYVTPGNGMSPQPYRQWSIAKPPRSTFCRKVKHLYNYSNNGNTNGIKNNLNSQKQSRRLVFSSPTSKPRLSSALRIVRTFNLSAQNSDIAYLHGGDASIDKELNFGIGLGLSLARNRSLLEARWRRLRAILS